MKLKEMDTKHLIGIIALGVAIAAAVVGAVLYFTKFKKKRNKYYIECGEDPDMLPIGEEEDFSFED